MRSYGYCRRSLRSPLTSRPSSYRTRTRNPSIRSIRRSMARTVDISDHDLQDLAEDEEVAVGIAHHELAVAVRLVAEAVHDVDTAFDFAVEGRHVVDVDVERTRHGRLVRVLLPRLVVV